MSHVKNIKGNKESQKTKTPQNSIDPELGLNPIPEPELGHDDGINVMFSEKEKRDDEIIKRSSSCMSCFEGRGNLTLSLRIYIFIYKYYFTRDTK
mgnify:CR=1 FL=1